MAGPSRLSMHGAQPTRSTSRCVDALGLDVAEAREIFEVCRQIGQKAAMKFATVREAFRFIGPDEEGNISKSDMHYFFRAYDVAESAADRIIAHFDKNQTGEVDWHKFVGFLRPYIQPLRSSPEPVPADPGSTAPLDYVPSEASSCSSTGRSVSSSATPRHGERDMRRALAVVERKAPQRFAHARQVLRILDVDSDGFVTRGEVRDFFRAFDVGEESADRLYQSLDKGHAFGIRYGAFLRLVGPSIDLPGIETALQRVGGEVRRQPLWGGGVFAECHGKADHAQRVADVQQCRKSIHEIGLRGEKMATPRDAAAWSGGPRPPSPQRSASKALGARRPLGNCRGARLVVAADATNVPAATPVPAAGPAQAVPVAMVMPSEAAAKPSKGFEVTPPRGSPLMAGGRPVARPSPRQHVAPAMLPAKQ